MELKMNYDEGVKYLKSLCNPDLELFSKSLVPNDNYPDFHIEYPGKKKNGDYKFYVGNTAYSHENVCAILLRNYIESCNRYLDSETTIDSIFKEYFDYLNAIYSNGTQYDYSGFSFVIEAEKNANLIYWTTMQEEVSYSPKENKSYWGRRMPLCRYYEALRIANVIYSRCNNLATQYTLKYTVPKNLRFYINHSSKVLNTTEGFDLSQGCIFIDGKRYGYGDICAEIYSTFIDSITEEYSKEVAKNKKLKNASEKPKKIEIKTIRKQIHDALYGLLIDIYDNGVNIDNSKYSCIINEELLANILNLSLTDKWLKKTVDEEQYRQYIFSRYFDSLKYADISFKRCKFDKLHENKPKLIDFKVRPFFTLLLRSKISKTI